MNAVDVSANERERGADAGKGDNGGDSSVGAEVGGVALGEALSGGGGSEYGVVIHSDSGGE